MDEDSRRSLHQLIERASQNDSHARAAVEDTIVALDRAGSHDNVAQALQMLSTLGTHELYQSVVTRLQENDYRNRQQHPVIG
jgi:hypothetical protein